MNLAMERNAYTKKHHFSSTSRKWQHPAFNLSRFFITTLWCLMYIPVVLLCENCNRCRQPFQNVGDYCLYFSSKNTSFFKAWENCLGMDSYLVSIENGAKMNAIWKKLISLGSDNYWWTSGNSLAMKGRWVWMDNGREFDYTRWNPGEPHDIDTERCMFISGISSLPDSKWYDYECHLDQWDGRPVNFICEYQHYC